MYKYKRKIDSIENVRKSTFVISDKVNTVICLNSDFSVNKPFNGLYIKNGKVIISNLFEEIITKSNKYKITNILSNNTNVNNEYISNIDLENLVIEYDTDEFLFSKKLCLEEKTGILAVEYNITNKTNYELNFKTIPTVTYRDIYNMKNSSMLKFNQRTEKKGVIVNLSISNNEDVILKSDKFEWNKDIGILSDGTIIPCCLDTTGIINLGNIYNEEINNILEKDIVKEMIDNFKKNHKCQELCKHCSFLQPKNNKHTNVK